MKWICALFLVFGLTGVSVAKTYDLKEHQIKLDVPDTWVTLNGPTNITLMVQDPTQQRAVSLLVFPLESGPIDASTFTKGERDSVKAQGLHVIQESRLKINGQDFDLMKVSDQLNGTPMFYVYHTFANQKVFTLSLIFRTGDPGEDPELQAILKSFRFTSPPKPVPLRTPGGGGQSQWMILGAVGVVVFILGAAWLASRRKKNAASP